MHKMLLALYRRLPWFRGKLRMGKFFFPRAIGKAVSISFTAHHSIKYKIPNTLENVGVELLINGVYENEVVSFLRNKIQPGNIFFDIGANIGSIGLPVLKKAPTVSYFAFEASPMVLKYLEYNCEVNGIINYKLVNKLVHNNSGKSMKFFQAELYGKSSLAPTYTSEFVMVDSITIDQFCEENKIRDIDWMKVDVQGFELFVFEGMKEMLQNKKVKNILFEFEEWAEDQAGIPRRAAINFIMKYDYELYSIDGSKWINNKDTETMIWAKAKCIS